MCKATKGDSQAGGSGCRLEGPQHVHAEAQHLIRRDFSHAEKGSVKSVWALRQHDNNHFSFDSAFRGRERPGGQVAS
jgi:hypothetical protein